MLIKYKGNTSMLLKDLAIELRIPVDLKVSEEVLKLFFGKLLPHLSQEKSIELIIALPHSIKPFCISYQPASFLNADFFSDLKSTTTVYAIMKVLRKYLSEGSYASVCSCLQKSCLNKASETKKEAFPKAFAA